MDHTTCKEQLSALLDGELNERERAGVTAHLAVCEDCRTYFAELTALHEALGAWEEEPVPEGFAAGVLARARQEALPRRRPRWARRAAALAACAAVALLAIRGVPRMGGADRASGAAAPQSFAMTTASAPAAASAAEEAATPAEAATPEEAAAEAEEDTLETQMLFLTGGTGDAPAETVEESKLETDGSDCGAMPEAANKAPADDTLTLTGAGAADWLSEHAEPLEDGRWRVDTAALDELPETLVLTGIQQPVDGAVIVTAEETEAAP